MLLMANYHFTTHWRFHAPLERVWLEIKAMNRWPEWWYYVERVELLQQGDADEIGAVYRLTWKTALPYKLTFCSRLVSEVKHKRLEGRTWGDLEGTGIWTFRFDGDTTSLHYDWTVKTTKTWMNIIAPVARPIFSWNHDRVMHAGYVGLKKKLASMEKTW